MGQKTNPIGNRLGFIRGWDSAWYGGKNFGDRILEDYKIRKYLHARLAKASVSKIVIERTLKIITVTISTSRPGLIIGKGGQEVDKLKEIKESIVVGQSWDNDVRIVLFIVMSKNYSLTGELINKIKLQIKKNASPRHIPSKIIVERYTQNKKW